LYFWDMAIFVERERERERTRDRDWLLRIGKIRE